MTTIAYHGDEQFRTALIELVRLMTEAEATIRRLAEVQTALV